MKYQIKNRFTGEIICEGEAENFIKFVEAKKANLSKADLSGANLSKADLSKANLYGANLYGAKIKITQKEELLQALKIEIDRKSVV